MVMTPEEIARDYRTAKSPRAQIGILAELNDCTKAEIAHILMEAGETVPKYYQPNTSASDSATADHPDDIPELTEPQPELESTADDRTGHTLFTLAELWDMCDRIGTPIDATVTVNGEKIKTVTLSSIYDTAAGAAEFAVDFSS